MPAQGKQRFPKWWQALILLVGGFVIFFSACAEGFKGLGGGSATTIPQNVLVTALMIGAGMFFVGAVLMLVVIVMAIVRAFRWQPASVAGQPGSIAGSVPGAASPHLPVVSPQQEEREILWRLRIAIIAVIVLASQAVFHLSFLLSRNSTIVSKYLGLLVVSYLLGQAPYVLALIRMARGADRLGIAVAMATACFHLFFWGWRIVSVVGRIPNPLRLFGLNVLWSLSPIAEFLVLAFAWQAGRIHPLSEDDRKIVAAVFFAIGAYAAAVHFALPHMSAVFVR